VYSEIRLDWDTDGSHILLSVPNATHSQGNPPRFSAALGHEPEIEVAAARTKQCDKQLSCNLKCLEIIDRGWGDRW